jgi:hypothetical protein
MVKSSKQQTSRPKGNSQTGSTSANFHEAARSEYLAHYVFAAFGTCVPIPRQEDTGLDLHCTLTERKGQRIWPIAPYSVQVKSALDKSDLKPWVLESKDSVQWLIEHPLPVLLCYVIKNDGRILIYHTSPRFYVWSSATLPERVELKPGIGHEGSSRNWLNGSSYDLSAPILDFTIQELLDDKTVNNARDVVRYWIVEIEQENLRRKSAGARNFKLPSTYVTNERSEPKGWIVRGIGHAESKAIDEATTRLCAPLDWLSDQLCEQGDLPGGMRGMLLLQHLYGLDRHWPSCLVNHSSRINELLGLGSSAASSTGIDLTGTELDVKLINALDNPAQLSRVTRLCLDSADVSDYTLERLTSAIKLRYLSLTGSAITDRGLSSLAGLTEIQCLFLGNTRVTDDGLRSLHHLTQISKLGLGGTRVSDTGLNHLHELECLENLYLEDTQISGVGFLQLKHLPRLETLVLNRTRVTNETLLGLADLPHLRRVDVHDTEVTVEGARELNKAVPNLAIVPYDV